MKSDNEHQREAYFERLYHQDGDPWRYDSCAYEIDKRADTLSFLRPHYARCCEVGCSIGVLTEALAPICDQILGLDISPTAAKSAAARLVDHPNADILVRHLPHDALDGEFDLFVLSEVLYFFDESELEKLASLAADHVTAGGDLIIVSYDGETETTLSGRASTERFIDYAVNAFEVLRAEQRPEYHVRLLRRRHASS